MVTEPDISLRVLCLEDDPHDAELLRERLIADGFDVEMSVAATREEFYRLLTSSEYDVILADYSLPDFDAPCALEAAADAGVRVPFICVSGTVGEDQAVELLKQGAADYVLKGRMGRLAFSVKRALKSAKEEAALKASQERFQQLFEHMADAVIVHDGAIILANPAAHRDFGYAEDVDMAGMGTDSLIHPDWLEAAHAAEGRVAESGAAVGPFEICLVRADGSSWYAEAIVSSLVADGRIVYQSTLRDLTERRRREDELAAYRAQLEQLVEERGHSLDAARNALASVTAVISRTVEIRDPYTAGHQRRVAELATAIAWQLAVPGEELQEIATAAAIHDIGKVSIPAEVLSKPAALSPLEFELVKTHSQAGYDIISSARLTGAVPEIVLQHHERCDGSGYPRGLKRDEILIGAKIIMVADVVEAMSSHRPYRSALGIEAARAEIIEGAGVKFDETVVEACLYVLDAGFAFEDAATGVTL